jgi:hypothetical protein
MPSSPANQFSIAIVSPGLEEAVVSWISARLNYSKLAKKFESNKAILLRHILKVQNAELVVKTV